MKFNYKVDNEVKQEFLDTKPTATAKSEAFVLRSADDYEDLINKPIYNMTYAELKEMLAMKFKNTSLRTVLKNVSILKTYIDFCIDIKIVEHGENRLTSFSNEEAKEFVHQQALLKKFTSKEKLKQYQKILYNEQDQLIIELSFIGCRGRTSNGNTLEEIINLSMNYVDEENRRVTFVRNNGEHRIVQVELSTIELIKQTFEQEYYIENNGEITSNSRIPKPRALLINKVENYVLRVPGKNKHQIFTANLLASRIKRIAKYLGNPYITFTSLYQSGMIDSALTIYKEKGDITTKNYEDICEQFGFGDNPTKYWYTLKELTEQYIKILRI